MAVGRDSRDELQKIFRHPPLPNNYVRNNEYKLNLTNLAPYTHSGDFHTEGPSVYSIIDQKNSTLSAAPSPFLKGGCYFIGLSQV
jgi:hypothetical protein